MNGNGITDKSYREQSPPCVSTYIWMAGLFWTVFVVAVLSWNIYHHRRGTLEIARNHARACFEKDLVYRRWSAQHGGVYVPVTKDTPPNPYLSHYDERDITTPSGRQLTLVNPAYMTRQVLELGAEQYGLHGHITSLNPIRPENAPDAWEQEMLEGFVDHPAEVTSLVKIEGQAYMRLIKPLVTERGCLKCHASQGYAVGDIRGGLSISVPMEPIYAVANANLFNKALGYCAIWFLGLIGIGTAGKQIRNRITLVEQAQEEVRKERDFAEGLVDTAQAIILVLDTKGRIVRFNPYLEKLSGYRLEEVKGKDWFSSFLPKHDHQRIRELFLQAIDDIPTYGKVNPIVTKEGRERDIEWYDKTIKDAEGHTVGLLSIGQDVTEHKENEEKIQETLAELERFNRLMTGREGRVMEMKKEVNALLVELGREPQYTSALECEKAGVSSDKAEPEIKSKRQDHVD